MSADTTGSRPFRVRSPLLGRVTVSTQRYAEAHGVRCCVYALPGGYEGRDAALGAPLGTARLVQTFDPPPGDPAGTDDGADKRDEGRKRKKGGRK